MIRALMTLARRALSVTLTVVSLALFAGVVTLFAYGRRQSVWLTCDDAAGRHYGLARFADGVVAYYVPKMHPGASPWSVWETHARHSYDYVEGTRGFAGFRAGRRVINVGDVYVTIPYWFLAVATGIPPAVALWRWWRRRRGGVDPGRCAACGYDLRATPEPGGALLPRCPECGRATTTTTAVAADAVPASLDGAADAARPA